MQTKIKYLVIDLFCGAGGTTLGFESAMSKDPRYKLAKVIACVNHDHLAIKSHWSNHPDVEHFEEDIRHLDPYGRLRRLVEIYRAFYPEAKVGLWGSLECTNFSKAKGGLPRDADSRTLADHLYKYILALDPDFIWIENVVEFMSWGPLDENGKPVSKKNGQDWMRWRKAICEFGYHDDWKQLNAADFGALTSRNRLFGTFARMGQPISWPSPTHTKKPEQTKISVPLKKWRAVKEALDFQDEGRSVFDRGIKRPAKVKRTRQGYEYCKLAKYSKKYRTFGPIPDSLESKTMQRLFMGCVKHVAGGKENYNRRLQGSTLSIVDDTFIVKNFSGKPWDKTSSVHSPIGTVTTNDNKSIAFITKWNSNNKRTGGNQGHSVNEPSPVVSTQNRLGAAFVVRGYSSKSGMNGASVENPCPAITTQIRERLAQVDFISRYNGVNGGKHDNSHSIEGPVGALGCGDNHAKVSAHFLANYYGDGGQHSSIELPSPTIPTRDRISKVQATFIDQRNGSGQDRSRSVDDPAKALTSTGGNQQLVNATFIANGNSHTTHTHSIEDPSPALLASRHHHYLINPTWFNENGARSIEEPCFVVVARQDKAPLYMITCKEGPVAVPVYEDDCEWTIKLKEFMVLFDICDIKMRMLKVMELKVIQGFPVDYVLLGNQTEQKKFIGNAVEKNVPKSIIEAMEDRELRMAA